eukprot:CAMPEP_0184873028 /NCGR_PEP_ID=MMETSP0580-20130426/41616_1 /TAXON_ID=1118495 /ORGANISM="Dactyliosolen fragilissimus" /LENGTH=317 /DNA_ID=CAMNT_0027375891 /DNA_START=44 /DNA_END=994 /DNA_ORIENTATION=-
MPVVTYMEDNAMISADQLFSNVMEEMSSFSENTNNNKDKNSNNKDNKDKNNNNNRILRLIPEVQGYGEHSSSSSSASCNETGSMGNIWNPYLRTPSHLTAGCNDYTNTMSTNTCTNNPFEEIARRRAYEKFKNGFKDLFQRCVDEIIQSSKRNISNTATATSTAATNENSTTSNNLLTLVASIWKGMPSHSILERWHFACKLEESLLTDFVDCVDNPNTDNNRNHHTKMDPILLPSAWNHGWGSRNLTRGGSSGGTGSIGGKSKSNSNSKSLQGFQTLLQNEIAFQFTRECKRWISKSNLQSQSNNNKQQQQQQQSQ